MLLQIAQPWDPTAVRVSIRKFPLQIALPAVIVHVLLLLGATWKEKQTPIRQTLKVGQCLGRCVLVFASNLCSVQGQK